jgi:hypothetical protein
MQTLILVGNGYGQSDSNWFYKKLEAETIDQGMAYDAIMMGVKDYSLKSMRATFTSNGITRTFLLVPTKDRKGYEKFEHGIR